MTLPRLSQGEEAPEPTPTVEAIEEAGHLGMVWQSTDPARVNQPAAEQPTFEGRDGIEVRINRFSTLTRPMPTLDPTRTIKPSDPKKKKPEPSH
ncbi:hypothetical protein H5392_12525 [Tessaracoccus sp. MC1865]|uniref:hypothetical protein n=1 Tax=Tessaracoccus sp. MC1865 TaxID=2760310 RepID=UPI001600276F|nr:hypothetical protein [Tessaracoccus sp. MC1865]MBB1484680.1 hypothetical protein [Tessaracoccus sp. MC1865]QTO36375.1 hypothetical protein J7D54_07530 [Tessaracoccus sp. MC1865]